MDKKFSTYDKKNKIKENKPNSWILYSLCSGPSEQKGCKCQLIKKFFNTKHKVDYAVTLSVGIQHKADDELAAQRLIFQTEGNFGSLTEAADSVKKCTSIHSNKMDKKKCIFQKLQA